jgi:hypothetical protein
MSLPIMASYNSLSVAAIHEHACFALFSTCLQLTGGDIAPW